MTKREKKIMREFKFGAEVVMLADTYNKTVLQIEEIIRKAMKEQSVLTVKKGRR